MKDVISALRDIVKHKQHAKVNGQRVDLYTASAIITVYDNLSAENQKRLAALPIPRMAAICFKLIK